MNKNENAKEMIVKALAVCFISIALYKLTGRVLNQFVENSFIHDFLTQFLFAVYATVGVYLTRRTDVYHAEKHCMKEGWKSAGFLIGLMMFYSFFVILSIFSITATIQEILLLIGQMLLVGYTEEILFRGLLQRAMHKQFGEKTWKDVFLAIAATGMIFGLTHLGNLMNEGVMALATVQQAVVNVFSGMYFCAIYFRTGKTLWYVAFLHALYDFIGFVFSGRLSGGVATDVINGSGAPNIVTVLIWGGFYLLAVLVVLRPKKVAPLLDQD